MIKHNFWVLVAFVIAQMSLPAMLISSDAQVKVAVHWGKVTRVSKTVISMEVCVEPPMRRGAPIHDQLFKALHDLNGDYVRYSPWFPYPKLAVAELDPPEGGKTSWDFSLLDPIAADFMQATAGHPVIMNMSTIPEWMFKTEKPISYPSDPDAIMWDYEQGRELRDPSMKEVGDYFARLASWFIKGGFKDEFGQLHEPGHHYQFAYWEVLNEVDGEHRMTPQFYTSIYDAIVASIRQVDPKMKFAGMALASPVTNPDFFPYFLNPKNHKPGTPLDAITYHFYANPTPDERPEEMQYSFFAQADGFLNVVGFIESVRKHLSPATQTFVNEIGTILPNARDPKPKPIPNSYWNLSGAIFAYVYARLATMGIDMAHGSELIDYPGQFAGTNMVDWETGQPTARYWVLKLLCDHFGPGDKLVDTSTSMPSLDPDLTAPYVYAQGFVKRDGKREILLINKRDRDFEAVIPGGAGARVEVVDQTTAFNPPATHQLENDNLSLPAFAVAVVTLNEVGPTAPGASGQR